MASRGRGPPRKARGPCCASKSQKCRGGCRPTSQASSSFSSSSSSSSSSSYSGLSTNYGLPIKLYAPAETLRQRRPRNQGKGARGNLEAKAKKKAKKKSRKRNRPTKQSPPSTVGELLNVMGVDRAKQPPNTGNRMKQIYPPSTSSGKLQKRIVKKVVRVAAKAMLGRSPEKQETEELHSMLSSSSSSSHTKKNKRKRRLEAPLSSTEEHIKNTYERAAKEGATIPYREKKRLISMVAKDAVSRTALMKRLSVKITDHLYKEARQHATDPNLGPGKLPLLIPVLVVIWGT